MSDQAAAAALAERILALSPADKLRLAADLFDRKMFDTAVRVGDAALGEMKWISVGAKMAAPDKGDGR